MEDIDKNTQVQKLFTQLIGADIVSVKPSNNSEITLQFTNEKIHIPFYIKLYRKINRIIWNLKTHEYYHKESDILFKTSVNKDIQERFGEEFYWAARRENSVTVYKNGDVIIDNIGFDCGEVVLFTNKGKRYRLAMA